MRRVLFFLIFIFLSLLTDASGQNICSSAAKANTLYCVPILGVENLAFIPSQNFQAQVPPGFSALSAAIGTQITQLPVPSPGSGVIFSFGPAGLTRDRELGPIFSERQETVGRHKLYLAFTYQYFQFDELDSVQLAAIPLQINGCNPPTPNPSCGSFIQTRSRLDLKVHQFSAYATYGLTSKIDLGVDIPFLDVRMGMRSACTVCSQTQPNGSVLAFIPNSAAASSNGIGDVTFRVKGIVWKGERAALAVGGELRLPTGDELNYLGSGAIGGRPFVAFGYRARISPHANIGYQWNGDSILATTTNVPSHLPNSLVYSAGAEASLHRNLSINADLLGRTFVDAERVVLGQRPSSLNTTTALSPDIARQTDTFNTTSFALGAKFIPAGNFLISGNVLFKLDHNGLHHKPAPMVGISYTF